MNTTPLKQELRAALGIGAKNDGEMALPTFDSDFLKAKANEYFKMLDGAADELEQARNDMKLAQVDKDMAKAKFRAVWLEFGRYFELIEAETIPITQHKVAEKKQKHRVKANR